MGAATMGGGFEVMGCLLVQLVFDRITPFFLEAMLSLVAGIMVGLALIELLPSCLEILKPVPMGCSCVGGMVFMFLSKSIDLSHRVPWRWTLKRKVTRQADARMSPDTRANNAAGRHGR